MKVFLILVITSSILSGCLDPEPPPALESIVKYSVDADIDGLSADIIYCDSKSEIISLQGEALPWELEMTPEDVFCGTAYLKAIISEAVAFVPFVSGETTAVDMLSLIDSSADFIASGVSGEDRIYKDPIDLSFVIVDEVESDHILKLKSDYYKTFPESYYIYHLINLNIAILHNDEILTEDTVEGYKRLESLVQYTIAE